MVSQQDEKELLRRSRDGDSQAFSELLQSHEQMVYNIALRFMRNATTAQDVTQDAFIKAFRLIGSFRGDCRFSSWMYRVAVTTALDELKRRKRRGEVDLKPEHVGATASGSEVLATTDLVHKCVAALPENYAAAVRLYYLEELDYDEIAEILDIPHGTLKTWLFRARKQLRELVQKELTIHEQAGRTGQAD